MKNSYVDFTNLTFTKIMKKITLKFAFIFGFLI